MLSMRMLHLLFVVRIILLDNILFICQAGGSMSKSDAEKSLSATTNTKFTFYGGHNGPAVAEMSAGRFPSTDVGHHHA